jgi:hypothetical protein
MHAAGPGFCGLIVRINDKPVYESDDDEVIWNEGRDGEHAEQRLALVFPSLRATDEQQYDTPPSKIEVWIRYRPCLDRCSTKLIALKNANSDIDNWIINFVHLWTTGRHTLAHALESLQRLAGDGLVINQIMATGDLRRVRFQSIKR